MDLYTPCLVNAQVAFSCIVNHPVFIPNDLCVAMGRAALSIRRRAVGRAVNMVVGKYNLVGILEEH